jgi:rod shape-determining protein MreB
MGFFNFMTHDIGIDLGTANILIVYNDEVVVDEPAIVAFDRTTNKVLAVGHKASQMEGKTHDNIRTVRPLTDGVIADFNAAEHMIRGMIQMVNTNKTWGMASLRMVICIPAGITEVEKRAIRDSAEIAGAKEVFLIHEPMAAAVGIGINVEEPTGNMIIDIGGGTSEIAVIAMSGIVCDLSVKVAGQTFNEDIVQFMRKHHNLMIGNPTAEKIKINVGSAMSQLDNPPEPYAVLGRDLMTGIPKEVMVTYSEVSDCLDKSISKIEEAVMKALEITPPELSGDIYLNGIYLTGGGALLRGLDKRISAKTKLPVHIADDPLRAVARGTGVALKNVKKFSFLMS